MQLMFEGMPAPPMESAAMVIPSVFYNQTKMLGAIMHLYGPIEADLTYSEGVFWRDLPKPWVRSDLLPTGNVVADFTALPFQSRSLGSIMIDPPFLIHGSLKPDLASENYCVMQTRFSGYRTRHDLFTSYYMAIAEAYRVLKPGGYLHFKTQDTVTSSSQVMSHCHVWQAATQIGFDVEDLFIMIATSKMVGGNHAVQQHARKWNSFVWSFRKPNRHIGSRVHD